MVKMSFKVHLFLSVFGLDPWKYLVALTSQFKMPKRVFLITAWFLGVCTWSLTRFALFFQITYSSFRFGTSERIDGNILTVDSAFTEDNDSFHPSSSFQSCQVPNPPLSSNSGHPPPSLSSYYHILTDIQEQVSKMCTISFFYLTSHKTWFLVFIALRTRNYVIQRL